MINKCVSLLIKYDFKLPCFNKLVYTNCLG